MACTAQSADIPNAIMYSTGIQQSIFFTPYYNIM